MHLWKEFDKCWVSTKKMQHATLADFLGHLWCENSLQVPRRDWGSSWHGMNTIGIQGGMDKRVVS